MLRYCNVDVAGRGCSLLKVFLVLFWGQHILFCLIQSLFVIVLSLYGEHGFSMLAY